MRIVTSFLLPVTLFAAALAAAPSAAAETKIAAIRTGVILRDAPQIRTADQKLKGEFEKREKEIESEGRKLGDDIKKFQREADTMSPQQRADTEKGLNTRKIDFDLKQRQFAEQAQSRNQELRREVLEKVNKAIEEVAKEKGIELVLQDPAYAAPGLDITDEVLKRLGFTAGAQPTGAKPADTKKK
jgi:outer membrane protein